MLRMDLSRGQMILVLMETPQNYKQQKFQMKIMKKKIKRLAVGFKCR